MSEFDVDIVIAGAGPSGLIVGSEAAVGGARVVILEKRDGPTWSRAGTVGPRVLEILESRGIVDRILKRANELHTDPHSRKGIWAGIRPIHYDHIDSKYHYVLMFAQKELEKLLAEWVEENGGEIRLHSEVTGFTQDEDGVTVRYTDPEGEKTIRARYLVGADGSKSSVRTAAGIAWEGTPAHRVAVNVDALIDNPHEDNLTVGSNPNGWAMTYPLRDGVTRFAYIDALTTGDSPDQPLGLEEAKAALRRVHGSDYGITEVDAINRFHDALYMAERVRDGRVFLVGESVRVHYPASGVGMNFAIQDAFNLGWKLAAAATDRAPEWLLDSFASERVPEINKLLDDVRRQLAIQFNFDEEHQALKAFLENEVLPSAEVNQKIAENLTGLSAAYPAQAGSAWIVGRRLADLPVLESRRDGDSAMDLLINQEFLLLDLVGGVGLPVVADGVRVVTASVDPGDRASLAGLASVLVRPDGHVAWASERSLAETLPEAEIREWLNLAADAPVFVKAGVSA